MTEQKRVRRLAGALMTTMTLSVGCALSVPHAELRTRIEAPHAVATPAGAALVAWGAVAADGAADIVLKRDGVARRVNALARTAVAGRQVGPRLALLPSGQVLVSWVDRSVDPAGDIVVALSRADGHDFASPVRVNDDGKACGQEYQDLTVLPDGRVAVAWLDERDASADNGNQKQVYCAISTDAGLSWAANLQVTSSPHGVCPCCRPGIAAGADGALSIIYRDRVGPDLFLRVATLRPGSNTFELPVTLSRAGWSFPACPVDGPSILATGGSKLTAAWMDGSSGEPTLWLAASDDGGRSFSRARPLVAAEPLGQLTPAAFADSCCQQPPASVASAHAALAFHPRRGVAAVWEDAGGNIWFQALAEATSSPQRIAGSEDAAAHSPQVIADPEGFRVLWVESRPDGATGEMISRLGEVRWNAGGSAGELHKNL